LATKASLPEPGLYHVVGARPETAEAQSRRERQTIAARRPHLVNTSLMADEENGKDRLTRLGRGHEFF
jgi:hypothetical protein